MMKYELENYRLEWQSARDCAGLLSHCLLLPEMGEKEWWWGRGVEKRKGKKELTVKKKQVGHIEISLSFIIYF